MSSSRRSSRRLHSSTAEPPASSTQQRITQHFPVNNGTNSSSSSSPPSSTSPATSASSGTRRHSQRIDAALEPTPAAERSMKDEEEATSRAARGRLRAPRGAEQSQSQVSSRKRGRSAKQDDEKVEDAEAADVKATTTLTVAGSSAQEAEAAEGDADADDGDAAEEGEEALSYEQQRQANIRRNAEQMRQLQLVALVPVASSAVRKQKRQAVEGGGSKRGTRLPSRRSLRNQGLAPDGSISEVKEGEGRYVPAVSDWQQRSRREGALDMREVKVEVRGTYNSSAAAEEEKDGDEEAEAAEGKQAQAAEAKEEKKEDATIDALCAAFVSLSPSKTTSAARSTATAAAAAAAFTPARIRSLQHVSMTNKLTHRRCTSLAFHPASSSSRSILVAGDKAGQVGVLVYSEPRRLREEAVQQAAFEPHAGAVNSFCFHSLTHRLYSASNDGSIRLFDFDRQQFAESFVNDGEESLLTVCSSPHRPNALFACDRKGDLIVLDTASASLTPASRTSLSVQKVNCVDVAAGGNLLASCGNDRTVRLWDLRAMRDESPLHSFSHGYSVNSVYFSPSGSLLLSTCIDDYLRVWAASSPEPGSWPECARIRHNNHTGRWVTLFRARWTQTDDAFIVGNMQRQVDVYGWDGAGGWSGGRQAGGVRQPEHSALTSAELTAIPSVIAVHPTNSCFMAATASSYAYVFA